MSNEPSQVRVSDPLAVFVSGFAGELAQQGYTPNSRCFQLRLLAHLSHWLLDQGLNARDLRATEVDRYLCARRAAGYRSLLSIKALRAILDYLRGLGVAPSPVEVVVTDPVDVVLERYRRYLTVERGLVCATADGYVRAVRPFLNGRVSPDGRSLDLEHLAASDVVSFVVAHCHQHRSKAKLVPKALRSLLRFLHFDGVIEPSLVSVVPSVAGWRMSGIPKALESDQIRRLLAACNDSTRSGCRDIAILIMLVRLGLRAIEVARLRLDDIDWRAGEIVVHGKGNCIERLPLPSDVGEAVAAYLQRGRPASAQGRTVFVRIKAPHRAMGSQAVSSVVAQAAQQAGLGRIYAHRLRHTAATQMLRAGASLPEVGQLLRHRCVETTAIYAKVNHEALRTIARRWPGDAT
jgi:site-specific recombinase XerD